MRILLLLLVIAPIFSCKKKEYSQASAIVDFAKHYTINSRYDRAHSVLHVEVILDKAVHAYAEGEKIGRPVTLVINEQNGWQALGSPDMPKGTLKKLSGLGDSIILEDSFVISQKLLPGKGAGTARLLLQVCSDNSCDQPREHPLLFSE